MKNKYQLTYYNVYGAILGSTYRDTMAKAEALADEIMALLKGCITIYVGATKKYIDRRSIAAITIDKVEVEPRKPIPKNKEPINCFNEAFRND